MIHNMDCYLDIGSEMVSDKHKIECSDFNNIDHSSSEIDPTHQSKKRHTKNKVCNDSIARQNIAFDVSEANSINKHKKKKHKKGEKMYDLHVAESYSDIGSEMVSGKHKMKCSNFNNIDHSSSEIDPTHQNKKRNTKNKVCNDSVAEQNPAFEVSEANSIAKHKKRKRKKREKMYDLHVAGGYTDLKTICNENNDKSRNLTTDGFNINEIHNSNDQQTDNICNQSIFNCVPKKRKHKNKDKKRKNYPNENTADVAVENISGRKHGHVTKADKQSKNSEIDINNQSKKKFKNRDEFYYKNSDNIEQTNECQLQEESVMMRDDENILSNELVNNLENNSGLLQSPEKGHVKGMQDSILILDDIEDPVHFEVRNLHGMETVHSLSEKQTIHSSSEIDPTHQNKKRHTKNKVCNDSIAEQNTAFDVSEANSINKHKKKKYRREKMYDLHVAGSYTDNGSKVFSPQEFSEECPDLNNTYIGTSEINLNQENKKHKKNGYNDSNTAEKNISFDEFEISSLSKHKKRKERHNLHKNECFIDNASEIISSADQGKRHQLDKECHNVNFVDPGNLNCQTKNDREGGKNCHLNTTEVVICQDSFATGSRKKCIKQQNEETHQFWTDKEASSLLADLEAITDEIQNSNQSIFNCVHKKRKHKNKERKFIDHTQTGENTHISKNYIDFNNEFISHSTNKKRKIHLNENTADVAMKNISGEKHGDVTKADKQSKNSEIDVNNQSKKKFKNRDESCYKNSDNIEQTNECQLQEESVMTRDDEIYILSNELVDNLEKNSGLLQSPEKGHVKGMQDSILPLDDIEDPVQFEVPILHKMETVHDLSEEQRKDLQQQGVFIKTGKFTKEEDTLIRKNFKIFSKKYGVSDPFLLLGIGSYGRDVDVFKFIKAKHFYVRLGKGLNNRTLHSIYRRARLILHPYKNEGNFDETEVNRLKRLHMAVSNKWNQIGEALGRTGANCLEAYRWHEKLISKGSWTEEEQKQLIEAIKRVSGSSDLACDKIKGINWTQVALHVPTRNYSQCRMYWANNFAWKSGSLKKKWDQSCYVKLINILSKEWDVEDASKIDWFKVHESFVDVAPSHIFVQQRWYYLKYQVPGYKNKDYKEIIKELCQKYKIDT